MAIIYSETVRLTDICNQSTQPFSPTTLPNTSPNWPMNSPIPTDKVTSTQWNNVTVIAAHRRRRAGITVRMLGAAPIRAHRWRRAGITVRILGAAPIRAHRWRRAGITVRMLGPTSSEIPIVTVTSTTQWDTVNVSLCSIKARWRRAGITARMLGAVPILVCRFLQTS